MRGTERHAGVGSALGNAWSVVVLAGGRSSRLGGVQKTELTIGGTSLLNQLLTDLPDDVPVIVVGPPTDTVRTVQFCREEPPFAGPLAGLAAAIPLVGTPVVVVLAGDMPRAGQLAPSLTEFDEFDALVLTDTQGRMQPLCAGYDVDAVKRALTEIGDPANRSMRDLTARLNVTQRTIDSDALHDVDTREDLERARAQREGANHMLSAWVEKLQSELGLDEFTIDTDQLLDVARIAAHQVERPAAPLSLYLMGLAVGNGRNTQDVCDTVERLANEWDGSTEG